MFNLTENYLEVIQNPPLSHPSAGASGESKKREKRKGNTREIRTKTDLLLVLILVLRIIPQRWIFEFEGKPSRNLVTSSKRNQLVTIQQDVTGEKYLCLSKKGFLKAKQMVESNLRYRTFAQKKFRLGSIHEEHHYLLMRCLMAYLWFYGQAERIWTAYEKDCSLQWAVNSHLERITPDAMIRPAEADQYKTLVCVESDTGSETQKELYDKLLRYFSFAASNFDGENLAYLQVCFCFKTKLRLTSIFGAPRETGHIFRFFNQLSLRMYRHQSQIRLRLATIVELCRSNKVQILAGTYEQTWSEYRQIDVSSEILAANPELAKLVDVSPG